MITIANAGQFKYCLGNAGSFAGPGTVPDDSAALDHVQETKLCSDLAQICRLAEIYLLA